jgi:hypothetical protein
MSRIKLLIYVGFLGWVGFMLMEFYQIGHIPDLPSVAVFALAGLALVAVITVPMIVGIRRQERMISEGKLQPGSVVSVPSRVKLYLVTLTITLVSLAVQILKPLSDRRSSVVAWNIGLLTATIALTEILYRFKNRGRNQGR